MKDWLCAGRVEELQSPGDYLAFHVAREPVLLTRNRSGELRAFSNMCAHRGAEIAFGTGNVTRFSCPYHGWSYDLDGRLTGAAYMTEVQGFAKENYRLPGLQVAVWQGWIFVNFDPEAAPFENFIATVDRRYGFLDQEKCRLGAKFELHFDCNWKLLVEQMIARSLGERDGWRKDVERIDAPRPLTSDGKPLFRASLVGKPQNLAGVAYLAPNLCMVVGVDHVHHLVSWPIGPDKSKLVAYIVFPDAYRADPEFEAKVTAYSSYLRERMVEEVPVTQERFAFVDQTLFKSLDQYLQRMSPAGVA